MAAAPPPVTSPDKSDHSTTVTSLLSMAEYFLTFKPQKIQEGVHCLLAVLSLHPPPRIEARTRLQLGLVLYHHSNNLLEAREHLDKAMLVAQSAAHLEDVRFEATSIAARILVEQNCIHQAKSLLKGRLEGSTHYSYWHVRLLLQLADVHACERDNSAVLTTLNRCVEYAQQVDAPYTRLLCLMYKGAYLLSHSQYVEAGETLNACSTLLEEYRGEKATLLRTFYLVIQVAHLLIAGQVKTAKPHLKLLQQCVKSLSAEEDHPPSSFSSPAAPLTAESFEWMTKEQTYAVVYLVSVMHSVQAGYTDKALSYADKALQIIQQQKDSGIVAVLKAHLLEQIVLALILQGKPSQAADKLHEVVTVCHSHPQLVYSHRAVLHTLLGLYAFSTESLERAVAQFHTALQHTNNTDLRVFVYLNLAVAYMKIGDEKKEALAALMQSLEAHNPSSNCQSLSAAVYYVKGLYSLCQLKLHEAKRHLRETLVVANGSDLNKLTTCALILLGQIFLSLGNTQETKDMVNPAMQLASKIPDKKLQVWAASLLADLFRISGDQLNESAARKKYSETLHELQTDQSQALQSPHNGLVQWTVGEWPVSKPTPTKLRRGDISDDDHSKSSSKSPVKSGLPIADNKTKHKKPRGSRKDPAKVLAYDVELHRSRDEEPMEIQRIENKERLPSSPQLERKHPPQLYGSPQPNHKQQQSPSRRHDATPKRLARNTPPHLQLRNSPSNSLTFKGSPVALKTPELRLNKVESPVRSLSYEGSQGSTRDSPVALKTPELRLNKVESPLRNFPYEAQLGGQGLTANIPSSQRVQTQVHGSPQGGHSPAQVNLQRQIIQQGGISSLPNLQQHAASLMHLSPTPPQRASPHHQAGRSPIHQLSPPQLQLLEQQQQAQLSPTPPYDQRASPHHQAGRSPIHQLSPPQLQLLEQQQQAQLSPTPPFDQRASPHHQARRSPIHQLNPTQLQLLEQQQQAQLQKQQQMQQHSFWQQQAMLQQHFGSPQKIHLAPSIEQQQQLLLQQQQQQQRQQQAFQQQQQQLMVQQAHQHYLLQQAAMRNQPAMNPQQYYAPNPTLPHKQSPPQLVHMNTLQRIAQEPSRTPLGMSQGPIFAQFGNPYSQNIHLVQNGPNVPPPGPLSHYNIPHGGMPGR